MHLVSFVGTTDGLLAHEGRGPILTAVRELNPESVTLLVTEGRNDRYDYHDFAKKVKYAILAIKPNISVSRETMELDDPTDHNDIYPKLRSLLSRIQERYSDVTAAISSGTPSMQVCWILLAEGELKTLRLVRTIEPSLSQNTVRPVRLGVGLPRIESLEQETRVLQEIALPLITLNVRKGLLLVGDSLVHLSPRMFTYYRYFLELLVTAKTQHDAMFEVRGVFVGSDFAATIVEYHHASFPESEDVEIARIEKTGRDIESSVFRSTVSKLNQRIYRDVQDTRIHKYLRVNADGPKSSRLYFINYPVSRVTIIRS
ncbi:MAG: hypothetical protein D8M52_04770 [Chlorobi bacterium]|nr:MAG: hypothetical protein F9K28_11125 [Bacteroidota bacterium]KXK34743.1 MAG: Regulator of RNA terminal phosphate cyclase [Chlorobi bacterium OLB6]MBE2264743.1 hypothetical protein [Flavobacteriales bacterium]MBL1161017.1 hypothetical protein [Chlorobiota bacterium]MBW7854598.1 hypothetical protein [Candidatus Kapabacteria bacterium]MCC6332167.1 hypothetical protein [Ignavibacteria bacterium]